MKVSAAAVAAQRRGCLPCIRSMERSTRLCAYIQSQEKRRGCHRDGGGPGRGPSPVCGHWLTAQGLCGEHAGGVTDVSTISCIRRCRAVGRSLPRWQHLVAGSRSRSGCPSYSTLVCGKVIALASFSEILAFTFRMEPHTVQEIAKAAGVMSRGLVHYVHCHGMLDDASHDHRACTIEQHAQQR